MGNNPLYIKKFLQLDAKVQRFMIRFVLCLLKAKVLVRFVPLKYYFKKVFTNNDFAHADLQQYYFQFSLLKKVIRRLPVRTTCLEESMAMQFYFRKFNVELPVILGIRKEDNDKLHAHAWNSFEVYQANNFIRIN
jgi:hypothetical protein